MCPIVDYWSAYGNYESFVVAVVPGLDSEHTVSSIECPVTAIGIAMLNVYPLAGLDMKLFMGYVPAIVSDELNELPHVSAWGVTLIYANSRVVWQAKAKALSEFQGSSIEKALHWTIFEVRKGHYVSCQAKSPSRWSVMIDAFGHELTELIDASGKAYCQQSSGLAIVEDVGEDVSITKILIT